MPIFILQGIPDNIEPGLDDRQLTRLLGLDLRDASAPLSPTEAPVPEKTRSKNASVVNLTEEEVSIFILSFFTNTLSKIRLFFFSFEFL
jgi:hypothetical protein